MAEVSAFIYGWIAGIVAVIVWILYGIDTLLQLMRFVNDAFARLPGLSHLASKHKSKRSSSSSYKAARAGESSRGGLSKFNVMAGEEGLEGLTGSTKKVTPITAGGLCMMSWYGPDGTTGPPVECRLALENFEVTVYQLLRLGDTNVVVSGKAGGTAPGGERGSNAQAVLKQDEKGSARDADTNAFRSAAGVTVAEHRKGRVSVLQTTVMELKHFNRPNKPSGENGTADNREGGSNNNNNNGSSSSAPNAKAKANSARCGSDGGSIGGRSQKRSKQGSDSDADTANSTTPKDSKSRRRNSEDGSGRESLSGGGNTAEGFTRPGVDPIFNGRVLIWRTMDGRPLFDSVHHHTRPTKGSSFAASMRRGGSSSNSMGTSFASNTNNGSVNSGGSFSASDDCLCDDGSMAGSADYGCESNTNNDDDADGGEGQSDTDGGASECGRDDRPGSPSNGGSGRGYSTRSQSRRQSSAPGAGGGGRGPPHHHSNNNNTGRDGQRRGSADSDDMSTWSCVIIRFERARESERWYSLLSGLREARAWHDYAKTLPNPDTINTFLSRFFFQNMRLDGLRDAIMKQIRKKLQELPAKKFPRDLGGQLMLDDFLLGTQIPWITDVSEPTASANGEIGFDFNLLYKGGEGGFTLFFRLALEFLGIRVPNVVFSVKLLELEATVHISIGPPPSKKFWIGGHKPPILRLEVRQGCASGKGVLHRVLTSLPDLSGIMTNLIKLYLFSDMVLPYMDDFPLPSVVKSPKGSMRDLRVRTFDRQRAAKISGAPARRTDVPLAAPATPLADHLNKKAAEKRSAADGKRDGEEEGEGAGERSSHHSQDPQSAAATSGDAGKNPSASAGTSQNGAADGSMRRQGTSSGNYTSNTTTTTNSSSTNNNGGRQSGDTSANLSVEPTRGSIVSSPITLTSPNNPSAASFRRTQARAGAGSGGQGSNVSFNLANSMAASTNNRSRLLSDDISESEDALSVASQRGNKGSSAMRNLKDLLKIKGKDMTRESVSRSKEKLKK